MDAERVIALWAGEVASLDDIRAAVFRCDETAEWEFDVGGEVQCLYGMPPQYAIRGRLPGPSRAALLAALPEQRYPWPAHLSMALRVGRADLRFFAASTAFILTMAPQPHHRHRVADRFDAACSAQWRLHGGTRAFAAVASLATECALAIVAGTKPATATGAEAPLEVDGWPVYLTPRDKALLALALLFSPQHGWCRRAPACAPQPLADFAAWFAGICTPATPPVAAAGAHDGNISNDHAKVSGHRVQHAV